MSEFTMEVPPIVETQLTGFVGAAIAKLRNDEYRVEWRMQKVVILKNGAPFVGMLPASVKKHAMKVQRFFSATHAS